MGVNSISNELESIAIFVQNLFPDARIERQNVPDETVPNLFVIRFIYEDRVTETRTSMRLERDWEIVYFGDNTLDVLDKMDALSKAVLNYRIVIPIKDSLRYIRINNFASSAPFETKSENTLYGMSGTMLTETREARSEETFSKIMSVSTVIK